MTYLDEKDVDKSTIQTVGCDGTAVNTGTKGGIVRLFEVSLKRPVNWFICQPHANKLPLRHVFAHLDGHTSEPKGFSGPIVKELLGCEVQQLVKFGCVYSVTCP